MIGVDVEDREARILEHVSLCRAAAVRFIRPGLDRSDLEQIASIGLIKAVDRFNAHTGTPFTAFAWPHIIGELMHYVRDHEHLIRMPRYLHELDRRESRCRERLAAALQREPLSRELASELQTDPSKLHALERARGSVRGTALNHCATQIASSTTAVEDNISLITILDELATDERRMILGVYGLRLTQTEAGERLGYSQRTASRLHKRALTKLAYALR